MVGVVLSWRLGVANGVSEVKQRRSGGLPQSPLLRLERMWACGQVDTTVASTASSSAVVLLFLQRLLHCLNLVLADTVAVAACELTCTALSIIFLVVFSLQSQTLLLLTRWSNFSVNSCFRVQRSLRGNGVGSVLSKLFTQYDFLLSS